MELLGTKQLRCPTCGAFCAYDQGPTGRSWMCTRCESPSRKVPDMRVRFERSRCYCSGDDFPETYTKLEYHHCNRYWGTYEVERCAECKRTKISLLRERFNDWDRETARKDVSIEKMEEETWSTSS